MSGEEKSVKWTSNEWSEREEKIRGGDVTAAVRHHFSFPSIFIYGHTASGKTYVTQTLLKTLELPHVFVNCVECFTLRLLLEQILNKLNHFSSSEDGCSTQITCETFNDFVRLFKQVTKAESLKDQTVYIVRNLQKILSHDHPPDYSADFYAAYINILLGVFYTVCRDLKELRHLAVLNFPKYCEPVVKGEASERDTRKLWRNIEPHLKKAMQTVYLREISSSQWEKLQKDDTDPGQLRGLSAYTHVELPYYSKFILIAAYLASYNPARTDKRFFLKVILLFTLFLKIHEYFEISQHP
ncbi:hypothetical protein HPG69_013413 [Diceros bicornis minor]|uniref:Origin recognition complex subunit 5 n=1 Tax=Diceros bicornis minor TaxID=77932 RepID=A0A7J7EA52_DICBM|nr:hypothetical protein HPG69_013413 [Diceros bicornis minor]